MFAAAHGQNRLTELPLRSLSSMTLMPLVSIGPRLAGASRGASGDAVPVCWSVLICSPLLRCSHSPAAVTLHAIDMPTGVLLAVAPSPDALPVLPAARIPAGGAIPRRARDVPRGRALAG